MPKRSDAKELIFLDAGAEGNPNPYPKKIKVQSKELVGMRRSDDVPPDEIHVINPGGPSPIVYKLDEVRYVQAKAQLARDRGMLKDRQEKFRSGRGGSFNRRRRSKS